MSEIVIRLSPEAPPEVIEQILHLVVVGVAGYTFRTHGRPPAQGYRLRLKPPTPQLRRHSFNKKATFCPFIYAYRRRLISCLRQERA
jgi:hypothetical protein